MEFTRAEEMELLAKYEPLLKYKVREYCARVTLPYPDFRQDLMQEARLAFLRHLRGMKDETQILRCHYDILHALFAARYATDIVHTPRSMQKQKGRRFRQVPLGALENILCESFEGEALSRLAVDSFIGGLSHDERTVVELKLDGYRYHEILPHTSFKSHTQLTRCVQGIKRKLHALAQGEI